MIFTKLISTIGFLFLTFLFSTPASAEEPMTKESDEVDVVEANDTGTDWRDGIHLIAGVGLNSAMLSAGAEPVFSGAGSNLRSDIGYYFGNGFGLELSGSVLFNTLQDDLLWTTTFAVGVRFGLPFQIAKESDNLAPYGRILVGRATNVVTFGGKPRAPFDDPNLNRIQAEGLMLGMGVGVFQRSVAGRIWYGELTLERHTMTHAEEIRDVDGVPTVIADRPFGQTISLYSLCVTFGLMVF